MPRIKAQQKLPRVLKVGDLFGNPKRCGMEPWEEPDSNQSNRCICCVHVPEKEAEALEAIRGGRDFAAAIQL